MKIIQDHIHCIITGGTIDSVFDAAKDMVVVNEASSIKGYIDSMVQPHFSWSQEVLTMRDSREMTDEIRLEILRSIKKSPHTKFLVTHGTYTMPDTARYLENGLGSGHDKTITLTGSMLPLKGFAPSDAPFKLGFAIASAFLLSPGVYLAMNGRVFEPAKVLKNIGAGRFEG